jgi:hypothetical protein
MWKKSGTRSSGTVTGTITITETVAVTEMVAIAIKLFQD